MRIGAKILLDNGFCYQSYGWQKRRPLGSLQAVVSVLDEYEVDEISIVKPLRGVTDYNELITDLNAIRNLKTTTPLSYGGGLRTQDDLNLISDLPVERLVISTGFINCDQELVTKAISLFGRQAILACLPVCIRGGAPFVFLSEHNSLQPLTLDVQNFCKHFADEIVIIDCDHEGYNNSFDFKILDHLSIPMTQLVISGGIGKQSILEAMVRDHAAVLMENRVLHLENSIEYYKK